MPWVATGPLNDDTSQIVAIPANSFSEWACPPHEQAWEALTDRVVANKYSSAHVWLPTALVNVRRPEHFSDGAYVKAQRGTWRWRFIHAPIPTFLHIHQLIITTLIYQTPIPTRFPIHHNSQAGILNLCSAPTTLVYQNPPIISTRLIQQQSRDPRSQNHQLAGPQFKQRQQFHKSFDNINR